MILIIILFIYLDFSHFHYVWLKFLCVLKLSTELKNFVWIVLFEIYRAFCQYIQSWIRIKIVTSLYIIIRLESIHAIICKWLSHWIIFLAFYQILYIYILILDILWHIQVLITNKLFFYLLNVISRRFWSCKYILYVSHCGRLVSLKNIRVWFNFIHISKKFRCRIVLVDF